ncbi:MAG: DUF1194 domain-containing protein [Hyphomicrobiales bacterium]|nr:DUF1194 domain-containing protein [Hyphomicrobiales bacterium]
MCCLPTPAAAQTRVSLELVLAVDSSTSVSDAEFSMQVSGYAKAFGDPDIIAAIKALGPDGIAVTYVKWSSHRNQVQAVKWTHVANAASARGFADAILSNSGRIEGSATAIGDAVIYSVGLFKNNGFASDRQIVDVSADDRYNAGSAPSYAQGIALRHQVTVNGLAIDAKGFLANYFRENVIVGEGSFVVEANSYEDFGTAIKLKLLRELENPGKLANLNQTE